MSAFSHTPEAWLYAYIQTSAPGYRKVSIGGTTYTIANTGDSGVLWPDFIDSLDTAINASGWSAEILASGAVRLSGPSAAVTWIDRLGALLGMAADPQTALGTITSATSSVVPYGGIPLYGATWKTVDISRSVEYEVSRVARTHGYVYGGARLWIWSLTMDRHALDAVRRGFVMRRRIRITGAGVSADIDNNNPDGGLTAWPLGIKSVRWLDDVQSVAEVEILVSGGAV